MATGGTEERHPNTCYVCLDADKVLKFLPCYHSFCGPCIQHLADRHPGETFPCPVCRKRTFLPSGGVASLQVNFYTQPESTQKKRRKNDTCKVHSKILEFYCAECDEAICLSCKQTKHERHETDDLTSSASNKKEELLTHQRCLQSALSDIEKTLTSLREEKKALYQKRRAVEKAIHRRGKAVVAAVVAKLNKELALLQSLSSEVDQNVETAISEKEGHKRELSINLQEVNYVIASGAPSQDITLYTYKIDAMTSQQVRVLHRPVLQSDVTADVMLQTVSDYIGNVRVSTVTEDRRPKVTVTQMFTCGEDPDTEVFSLCYEDRNPPIIRVSFDCHHMNIDAPVKVFTLSGQCVLTDTAKSGKVSSKRYAEELSISSNPQPGMFATHCKSHAAHFKLVNFLSGTAVVNREVVTCTDPLNIEIKREFTIEVGPHRAFDVDVTGQHYVVLEEPKWSTTRRSVLLYGRSEKSALSSYNPPVPDFSPSDVCFYSLEGRQVLLVTDKGRDEIHVVSIGGRDMKFERCLCPGCPSLIQPTALTVDIAGRLWVACSGGAVLMMEPRD